jgi:hypothetical protein
MTRVDDGGSGSALGDRAVAIEEHAQERFAELAIFGGNARQLQEERVTHLRRLMALRTPEQ